MSIRLNTFLALCCLFFSLYLFFIANDQGRIASPSSSYFTPHSAASLPSDDGQVQHRPGNVVELLVREASLEKGRDSNIEMNMWVETEEIQDLVEKIESQSALDLLDIEPFMHHPSYCHIGKPIPGNNGTSSVDANKERRSWTSGWVPYEKPLDTAGKLDWIFYVHSSIPSRSKRQVIRNSWGRVGLFKKYNFKVIFVLGRPSHQLFQDKIEAENSIYGDILQGDFIDAYKNLTYKAVFTLRWLSTYCRHVPIALKADDDTFINIFELKDLLVKYSIPVPINPHAKDVPTDDLKAHSTRLGNSEERAVNSDRTVICHLNAEDSVPIWRNKSVCMKWCLNRWELRERRSYPQFCAGIFYILTMPLVQELYNRVKSTPFLWIDDVYVTGLLTRTVPDINYVRMNGHVNLKYLETLAHYRNTSHAIQIFVSHISDDKKYSALWNQLLLRLTGEQLSELTVPAEDLKLRQVLL